MSLRFDVIKVLKFDPINGFRAQGSGSRNAARTPSEPISLKMLHTTQPDQWPYSIPDEKISLAANPVEPYRIITLKLNPNFFYLICPTCKSCDRFACNSLIDYIS